MTSKILQIINVQILFFVIRTNQYGSQKKNLNFIYNKL